MNTKKVFLGLILVVGLQAVSCTSDSSDTSIYSVDKTKVTKGPDAVDKTKVSKGTDAVDKTKVSKGTDAN